MPKKETKSLKEQIWDAKVKEAEIERDYCTQLYLETMPEFAVDYEYNYTKSNFTIPFKYQSVDAWLRAIIKHMASRRYAHGGAITKALVITVPDLLTDAGIEKWIAYETDKLRKRAKKKIK